MRFRITRLVCFLLVLAASVAAGPPAYAQSGSNVATLTGVVVDAQGGVVPGADVSVKNNATGVEFRTVTDSAGRFAAPGLLPATYTVKISLMGFKTFVAPDVKMYAATPANIRATLEIGALEESVIVTGAAEVMETQSAAIQTTLQVKQIQNLPVATRTALDYIQSLPGLNTRGSGEGSSRASTINNLPNRAMNVTLDGVNVGDNRSNAEGFYMYIRPMMDSVEEITVTTATEGADSSASGAAQVKMTTRSGTNTFSAAAYNTWRNQAGTSNADTLTRKNKSPFPWSLLNTPYWFNKRDIPKTAAGEYFIDDIRLTTPGIRVAGPIIKDKLFFFGNYEAFNWPASANRIRWMMKPATQNGTFVYKDNSGNIQTVNVLNIAAGGIGATGNAPQVSTVDPVMAKFLADIRTAGLSTGGVDTTQDLNEDKLTFSAIGSQFRFFPTGRIDYNITRAHRASLTFRWLHFGGTPDVLNGADPYWPGFPNTGGQSSERYSATGAIRSTLGKNKVNEFQFGLADATLWGTYFLGGVTPAQFNCQGLGCQSIGGQGYYFSIQSANSSPGPNALSDGTVGISPSADVAAVKNFDDTFTWLKGAHTFSAGLNYTRITWRAWQDTVVKGGTLSYGVNSNDPAYTMFGNVTGAANYPGGIDATQAGYARGLYAVLTARVTAIGGTYYADSSKNYQFNGQLIRGAIQQTIGGFLSDAWRIKPNLTLNGGLRYEVQLPILDTGGYAMPQQWQMVYGITGAGTGSFGQGNMFKPGTMTGTNPVLQQYDNSKPQYNIDWGNVGPSVGFAWRPQMKGSIV